MMHQFPDLFSREFAVVSRHLVSAFADDVEQFVIRLFLHIGRAQGTNLLILSDHGVARAGGAMASRTSLLVGVGSFVGQRAA